MKKEVRIHLVNGNTLKLDCSDFKGDNVEAFRYSVVLNLLEDSRIVVDNLIIPITSVLYIECLLSPEGRVKTEVL